MGNGCQLNNRYRSVIKECDKRDPHTGRADNIPAKDFFHKRLSIREGVTVCEGGKAIRTNNSVNFSLGLLLHIREQCHSKENRVYCWNCLWRQVSLKTWWYEGRRQPCQHHQHIGMQQTISLCVPLQQTEYGLPTDSRWKISGQCQHPIKYSTHDRNTTYTWLPSGP